MTGEVGRLQKERQALEQQIGDLFTFYAKQKSLTAGLVTVVLCALFDRSLFRCFSIVDHAWASRTV